MKLQTSASVRMLLEMIESDQLFDDFLAFATFAATRQAENPLADYVAVRTANDQLRAEFVARLFSILRGAAEHAARKGVRINTEQLSDHQFTSGLMTLRGDILRFRYGLRCLTVEAGWTRRPSDGFMRGNALAVARLSHFGVATATEELHLLKFDDAPDWFRVGENGLRQTFEPADIVRHFRLLLEI